MKWRNGLVLVVCFSLLALKASNISLNPKTLLSSLQGKLPAKELEVSIDWAKEVLQSAQEDPQIAQLLQASSAAPRQDGCASQTSGYTSGFNTAQWLEFKQRAQPGFDQEQVIGLLGSYYCPIAPESIRRPKYRELNRQGKVQVMRWLPANELSRENVLDIYFENSKLVTFELYRLK